MTAQLSLGFWVNLLDAKGSEGLWRLGLHRAFPGGRREASRAGARYQRAWVVSQLRLMRVLRNRCAHHEVLINGVPVPGQARRMSVGQGIATYMLLTRMIDRDLAAWMLEDTATDAVLMARPSG